MHSNSSRGGEYHVNVTFTWGCRIVHEPYLSRGRKFITLSSLICTGDVGISEVPYVHCQLCSFGPIRTSKVAAGIPTRYILTWRHWPTSHIHLVFTCPQQASECLGNCVTFQVELWLEIRLIRDFWADLPRPVPLSVLIRSPKKTLRGYIWLFLIRTDGHLGIYIDSAIIFAWLTGHLTGQCLY